MVTRRRRKDDANVRFRMLNPVFAPPNARGALVNVRGAVRKIILSVCCKFRSHERDAHGPPSNRHPTAIGQPFDRHRDANDSPCERPRTAFRQPAHRRAFGEPRSAGVPPAKRTCARDARAPSRLTHHASDDVVGIAHRCAGGHACRCHRLAGNAELVRRAAGQALRIYPRTVY